MDSVEQEKNLVENGSFLLIAVSTIHDLAVSTIHDRARQRQEIENSSDDWHDPFGHSQKINVADSTCHNQNRHDNTDKDSFLSVKHWPPQKHFCVKQTGYEFFTVYYYYSPMNLLLIIGVSSLFSYYIISFCIFLSRNNVRVCVK